MRILIVEDEARIAKRIERMTQNFFGLKLQTITKIEALNEAIEFIKDNPIDFLLLDLNLNGQDGFTVLQSVVSNSFHTIIISAYTEKAISAFKFGVLDFVPKPFDENRLLQAFLRIPNNKEIRGKSIKFLAVRKGDCISLINVEDLDYIKGAGIYSELHLKNGKREINDQSLEKLEQLLPDSFARIHKSYLVDIHQAKEITIQSGSKYWLLLKNGEVLPIGRTRYKRLKKKFFEIDSTLKV